MKGEVVDDPSRRIVIVKFPYIVFRWYTHHEKVPHTPTPHFIKRVEGLTDFPCWGTVREDSPPNSIQIILSL